MGRRSWGAGGNPWPAMSTVAANSGMSHGRRGNTPPGGASTFDLFSWSEGPDVTRSPPPVRHTATNDSNAFVSASDQSSSSDSPVGRPTIRMHQPAGGISTITFGEQLSAEEADALLKRRPGSDLKKREMYGSGIFPGGGGHGAAAASSDDQDQVGGPNGTAAAPVVDTRTSIRCYQSVGGAGVSQISFGGENCASPKKAVTVPEVAKQKELSGTVETTDDLAARRVCSNAKSKELIGSKIFAAPTAADSLHIPYSRAQELLMRREEYYNSSKQLQGVSADQPDQPAAPRNIHTSVKVSNPAGGRCQISFGPEDGDQSSNDHLDVNSRKLHDQKKAELSGHGIFTEYIRSAQSGDSTSTAYYTGSSSDQKNLHHQLSKAKLKEISGSDIFSDDKPADRDFIGGIRKPPGGGSTISLQ